MYDTLNFLELYQTFPKIVRGDETYIRCFDLPIHQESRLWIIHEDEETPIMTKKQLTMKRVMYAIFFRRTGLVNNIKLNVQNVITAKCYSTNIS